MSQPELSINDRLVVIDARARAASQLTRDLRARIANGQDVGTHVKRLELDIAHQSDHFEAIDWPADSAEDGSNAREA